jgi:hypothetical protein
MKWCISFSGAPLGDPGEGFFVECLQDMRRRAQETGISPLGGPVGELCKVLVCWDLCELWRRVSHSMGAPQATLGRGPFAGNSERSLKGGSGGGRHISLWVLREGKLEGAALLVTLKCM